MQRDVSARIRVTATGPSLAALAVSVAQTPVSESLEVRDGAGRVLPTREILDTHGTRIHLARLSEGPVEISYAARVVGRVSPPPVTPLDEIVYVRQSRYCESDALVPLAQSEFAGLDGAAALAAVEQWTHEHLSYTPGVSLPTDGALATLEASAGVCRDYAHVVVALLRALEIPARVAAVYAPGLTPMDFHAVAEAAIDGQWRVVDATRLAPRDTLLRIATGRDAADTAFLDTRGAEVIFEELWVDASSDELSDDDHVAPVELG